MFVPSLTVTKSRGKEVAIMKKLIALTTVLCFVLSNAVPARAAFTSDVKKVLNAEADLKTGVADKKTLTTTLYSVNTDGTLSTTTATKLSFTYASGKTWQLANEVLELTYEANLGGWGVQIYTDNTSTSASPKWIEKPTDSGGNVPDVPAGLIGEKDVADYIAVPMAWKAMPGVDKDGKTAKPKKVTSVSTSTDFKVDYTIPTERTLSDAFSSKELYQLKDGTDYYGKYCFITDKKSQGFTWTDSDSDGVIDESEKSSIKVVDTFADADEYNVPVNYLGASTCTYNATGSYIFRDRVTSPVYVVLAADTSAGTIKSTYKTNTLTLELFHE